MNDKIVIEYGPFFNKVHSSLLTIGAKSKANRKANLATLIPEYLEKMKQYYKEGWVVGDGKVFYMADFYIGSVWTDILNNPGSWIKPDEKKVILD